MTTFTLQDALGSETNYNNLFDGSNFAPFLTTSTTLELLDASNNAIVITGQNLTYSFAPPAITGGDAFSLTLFNSSTQELLSLSNFPLNYSAANLFQTFAQHGLSGLFNLLNAGNDVFVGNSFANTLRGGGGRDNLFGGGGNDHLYGGLGGDHIYGGAGNDFMDGGADLTTPLGNALFGGADNDTLVGGVHNDTLNGGTGNDLITGGHGNDLLVGGLGYDSFVFRAGDGADTIQGFAAFSSDALHHNQDHIVVNQQLMDHFTKHLVTDAVTHAVLGVEVDFFLDAGHTSAAGSIFLQGVLHTTAITLADFTLG
ncbi:hypothetical protein GC209_07360 [bacterium]|nr:hypothetical protein [bacterium]